MIYYALKRGPTQVGYDMRKGPTKLGGVQMSDSSKVKNGGISCEDWKQTLEDYANRYL